jgi:hypothetical protein
VGWRLAVDAGLQTCPSGPGLWATVDDRGRVLHYLPVVVDVLNLRDDPLESPHPETGGEEDVVVLVLAPGFEAGIPGLHVYVAPVVEQRTSMRRKNKTFLSAFK